MAGFRPNRGDCQARRFDPYHHDDDTASPGYDRAAELQFLRLSGSGRFRFMLHCRHQSTAGRFKLRIVQQRGYANLFSLR